jgi:N-acetylmuramoyl-L-alanine amidase
MSPIGKITHIVIHYSATYPDQDLSAADIDRMHRARTPPFRSIGYHWFIRRDGTVEPGRPETEQGAHVIGQNAGKLGICWAGGLERASGAQVGVNNMTRAQEQSLIRLIRELLERYPQAKVVGHRDLAPTLCPGFDVIPWWAKVEQPPAPVPRELFASVAAWFASFRRAFSPAAWR